MWPRQGVWQWALLQVLQNSWSRIFMLWVKTLSARDHHWRNPRKKHFRAWECRLHSKIKSARVSALTGSAPSKMAEGWQRVSALIIMTMQDSVDSTVSAQDQALRNCRTNWQSSKQQKPRHSFSCWTTTFYFSESIRLTEIVAKWYGQFLQRLFCSVKSPCVTEAMNWSYPSHSAETKLLWNFGVSTWYYLQYLQSYLEIFFCHSAAAVPLLESENISHVCQYISRYALFQWLVPEKIAFSLGRACSVLGQNIDISFGPNGPAAPLGVREKPSWIDWTIEISPSWPSTSESTLWVLDGRFPARMSHFRGSHHTTYCARRSLTSYRPVMHKCSHIGATTQAELLKKWRFSQFLLGWFPRWSRGITRGFESSAAQSVEHDDWLTFMKHLVERKSQFPCGILFLHLAQKHVRIWGRHFS